MHRVAAGLSLLCLALLGVGLIARFQCESPAPAPAPTVRLLWTFEAPRPGAVVATPRVTPDAVYLPAVHFQGFHKSGALYAIGPATGKLKWTFDRGSDMLPSASSPVLADGRLHFGEGMHANFVCRLYCLDPRNGQELWSFETGDHIEGGPVLDGGRVIFPAGNDGIYALDAATGAKLWNFRAGLHIDGTPCVAGGRVFAGSGPSRLHQATEVVCLDAESGQPVWRSPVRLPAWASPAVAGDRVFAALGNGRLHQAAENPGGGLVCLDAESGEELWDFPVADAVFTRPAIAGDTVIFGSRDGHLHGVSFDGKERFRVAMGGPVIASPTVEGNRLFAVSLNGRVVVIDPGDGREVLRHELDAAGTGIQCFAQPAVAGGRLLVAAEMPTAGASIVTLFCLELLDLESPPNP